MNYDAYKDQDFNHRRFKHAWLKSKIEKLPLEKEIIGYSYEGREIYKIKIGTGSIPVLLWSQMHGNEATATMAIFDLFNYFDENNKNYNKTTILNKLTLHFVPMLNPDGAERFKRQTAQNIDMNRDALALQCPESVLLKKLVLDLKPEFAFNLHDQNIRYAAGNTPNQAAISFLATAYNAATDWNPNRTKAAQVIAQMNAYLQPIIPNKVGRFSDEFEPRAFGDNIQKWGSSLILIESGGFANDTEKMYLRQLNYEIILEGLTAIAKQTYAHHTLEQYQCIPLNTKSLFDLKIKNVKINTPMGDYKVDIGINLEEENSEDANNFEHTSVIEDLGDLSVFYGLSELDANGASIKPLQDRPDVNANPINLGQPAYFALDYGNQTIKIINGKIVY